VRREHDTRFPEGEEVDGDHYKSTTFVTFGTTFVVVTTIDS
jgi:hypothetical protein